jgi:HD superfamily phosphohydrolase
MIIVMDVCGQIMDKVQKLTGALYRVTDLLSDKEPLKWALRNKAINIYDNITSLIFVKNKDNIIEETLNNFCRLINILELIPMTAFISNLNFEILKKEYVNLKAFIEDKRADISPEQKLLSDISIGQKLNGHIEGNRISRRKSDFLNGRKQKICDFLANQGPKNISEITPIFEEISEKSIQRDLLDLVQSGKLKTEGEKRWRKYSVP